MENHAELEKIYSSEINFVIISEWDIGFRIKLGSEMNGFVAETTEDTLIKAITWLIDQVMNRYPDSLYTYTPVAIINKLKESFIDTDKFTPEFLNEMLAGYEKKHPHIRKEIKKEWLEEAMKREKQKERK